MEYSDVLDAVEGKNMSKIRVLIAEDHTIVRQGFRKLVEGYDGFEVVGEAEDGLEAIEKAKALLPDIVIMDITMPELNGVEAARQIKKILPEVKIVILTMYADKKYINQALHAGAVCYLDKKSADTDLIAALQAAYHNEAFLSPSIHKIVVEDYVQHSKPEAEPNSLELLTPAERLILQLVAEGKGNKEMAHRLSISINTVRNHRANIRKKLNIHDVAGLTKYAVKKGLIK